MNCVKLTEPPIKKVRPGAKTFSKPCHCSKQIHPFFPQRHDFPKSLHDIQMHMNRHKNIQIVYTFIQHRTNTPAVRVPAQSKKKKSQRAKRKK